MLLFYTNEIFLLALSLLCGLPLQRMRVEFSWIADLFNPATADEQ